MSSSKLPVALALTVATALLLAACGGGSPRPSPRIPGIKTGSATPSASASGNAAPQGAPKIALPADVKVEITDPPSKDAATDRAVADLKYAIMALRDGLAQGSGEVPSMLHSYGMEAGVYWSKRIKKYKDAGKTISGTYRYYNISVVLAGKNSGTGYYCEDQRKAFSKVIKTGEVNRTTPSNKDFYRFTVKLQKEASGPWKVAQAVWTQGDSTCVTS